jgi:hypothetical protein
MQNSKLILAVITLHRRLVFGNFTSLKGRIALQVASKIAPSALEIQIFSPRQKTAVVNPSLVSLSK